MVQRAPARRRQAKTQQGLTLIELMIALVLGIAVVGAAISAFSAHLRTQIFVQELTLMNNNSRFALELLAGNLRMAGNTHCPSDALRQATATADKARLPFANTIEENQQAVWYGNYPAYVETLDNQHPVLKDLADPESDSLLIHRIQPERNAQVKQHSGTQITTTKPHPFARGQALLAVDARCTQAATFTLAGGEGQALIDHSNTGKNCRSALFGTARDCRSSEGVSQGSFSPGSYIYALNSALIFLDKTGQLRFKTPEFEEPQTLVDQVEHFEVRYGLDTDEDAVANLFKAAKDITAADQPMITSVDLFVLFKSQKAFLPSPIGKRCGRFESPTDNYLRSCYQSRINLRNRGGDHLESLAGNGL